MLSRLSLSVTLLVTHPRRPLGELKQEASSTPLASETFLCKYNIPPSAILHLLYSTIAVQALLGFYFVFILQARA